MTIHTDNGPIAIGTTLTRTLEVNGYDDSDFYACYWDGERIVRYMVGSTRFANGWCHVERDADDDTRAAAVQWAAHVLAPQQIERDARAAIQRPGTRVVVVRGRKIPKGTTGAVQHVTADRFDRSRSRFRLGIRLDDGELVWTSSDNVAPAVMPDVADVAARLARDMGDYRLMDAAVIAARTAPVAV